MHPGKSYGRYGNKIKFIINGGTAGQACVATGGKILFIELKATGKTMRVLQVKRKRQLEELGFLVYCIDDVQQIKKILMEEVMPK